jgi:tetratricopeptide (TPR) repeat protein
MDGRTGAAAGLYERALKALAMAGDMRGRANALAGLADVEYRLDRYEPSRKLYLEALPMFEQQGDVLGQTYAELGLALVGLAQRRDADFETHLRRAGRLAQQQGSAALLEEVARIQQEGRALRQAATR